MSFDVMNVALSEVILRNSNLDAGAVSRSSIAAGLLPGVLGLVLPVVAARTAGQNQPTPSQNGGTLTIVPDVSSDNPAEADAATTLKRAGLVAVQTPVYDANVNNGSVVRQDPAANDAVPLGSSVTLYVSQGAPPVAGAAPPVAIGADNVAQFMAEAEAQLRSVMEKTVREQIKTSETEMQRLLASTVREQIKASEERILHAMKAAKPA